MPQRCLLLVACMYLFCPLNKGELFMFPGNQGQSMSASQIAFQSGKRWPRSGTNLSSKVHSASCKHGVQRSYRVHFTNHREKHLPIGKGDNKVPRTEFFSQTIILLFLRLLHLLNFKQVRTATGSSWEYGQIIVGSKPDCLQPYWNALISGVSKSSQREHSPVGKRASLDEETKGKLCSYENCWGRPSKSPRLDSVFIG